MAQPRTQLLTNTQSTQRPILGSLSNTIGNMIATQDQKIRDDALAKVKKTEFDLAEGRIVKDRLSEEAAISAVNSLGTRKWMIQDHPEEIKKEISRLKGNYAKESASNINFLMGDGGDVQLEKTLDVYRSLQNIEGLGKAKVDARVAERRIRLKGLYSETAGLDSEVRSSKINDSQTALFASRISELDDKVSSGRYLTSRQKAISLSGSAKGITRAKDREYVSREVMRLAGGNTVESLRASEDKYVATQNAIAGKAWNSKIDAANRYNASGGKGKGDGGYGDILEILKNKGQYGSWDEDSVSAFVKDAGGINLKSIALAIHLGTTGTDGTFFDKGFPHPDSVEYTKLLASAIKLDEESGGGKSFKTIDVNSYAPPQIRKSKSVGRLQLDEFSRGSSLPRSYLEASENTLASVQDWKNATRAKVSKARGDAAKKKLLEQNPNDVVDPAIIREVASANVAEGDRAAVTAVISKNVIAAEDLAKTKNTFYEHFRLPTGGTYGFSQAYPRPVPLSKENLNKVQERYDEISKSSTDVREVAKALKDLNEAKRTVTSIGNIEQLAVDDIGNRYKELVRMRSTPKYKSPYSAVGEFFNSRSKQFKPTINLDGPIGILRGELNRSLTVYDSVMKTWDSWKKNINRPRLPEAEKERLQELQVTQARERLIRTKQLGPQARPIQN